MKKRPENKGAFCTRADDDRVVATDRTRFKGSQEGSDLRTIEERC